MDRFLIDFLKFSPNLRIPPNAKDQKKAPKHSKLGHMIEVITSVMHPGISAWEDHNIQSYGIIHSCTF
jgi:hypothetical protein